jgi:hypothetical protein
MEDSIEIVRQRQWDNWATVVARWTEEGTRQTRRGAVDVVLEDGLWRARGGWSANANHDATDPVWRAWGSSRGSLSGWVSDPACAVVRLRNPDGRIESDVVESGVAILIYEGAVHRDAVVESLDNGGNVLRATALHPA